MGTLIVRLGPDQYVKWSNTTDSPVSCVMDRAAVVEHLERDDHLTFSQADHLVVSADETGTSDPHVTFDELLATNRAGVDESCLSLSEILRQYRAD
jgi:hypothetical protein